MLPRAEVTPAVAVHALRKILQLERENPGSSSGTRSNLPGSRKISGGSRKQSFIRTVFVSTLVEIVCGSREPGVILDGLATVTRYGGEEEEEGYRDKMMKEVLLGVAEGIFSVGQVRMMMIVMVIKIMIFSVGQVCQAIHIVSGDTDKQQFCDKLWFGLVD